MKGPWTKEEDQKIIECIAKKMTRWSEIAECVEGRVGKQCRERWFNHLDPTLRKCSWTPEEDEILVKGQAHFGNRSVQSSVTANARDAFLSLWSYSKSRVLSNMLSTVSVNLDSRGHTHVCIVRHVTQLDEDWKAFAGKI